MLDRDGYRNYLLRQKDLTENTVNSYCTGLTQVSQHCAEDVFAITDLQRLAQMVRDYGIGGVHANVGDYGNGTARNALRHWMEFVAAFGRDNAGSDIVAAKTWLLTWNPQHFKDGGDAGVSVGKPARWTCHSKQPQPGDYVFLIRLGVEPRGIVASGTVTRASFEEQDWRDPTKTRNYIEINPTETRADCASGLLPMLLLEQMGRASAFKWSAQSSGIGIPEPLASNLHKLWNAGRGQHSLKQYVEWGQADPEERRDDWLSGYRSCIEAIKQVQLGNKPLDDAMLDWVWRIGSNGVCTVSPGFLSNTDYERNKDFLRQLALDIFADPAEERYNEAFERWNEAQRQGLFRQCYTAVIHRVFAAAAPDRYTTIVKADDCRTLLGKLASEFELPQAPTPNWVAQNAAIKACLTEAGLTATKLLENNIAAWQLVAAFKKRQGIPPEQGPAQPVGLPVVIDGDCEMTEGPLNLILYGPPGTGKTYHTVEQALAILEPDLLKTQGMTRAKLKAAFDHYAELGQIVFTTFHQSFSYEDFVEGLRATAGAVGQIEYRVEDGVFKRLCVQARSGRTATDDPFEKAITVLGEKTEQAEDGQLEMHTTRGKPFRAHYSGDKTFLVFPASNPELKNGYTANMENVRALYQSGEKSSYNASYVQGMLDYLKLHCGLPEKHEAPTSGERKRFVLIIDEINRGNVSRILGELITLIEPSKREAREEALSVQLPYSKSTFSVPDNVYLIGTMNTTDRSLAGLDIALRRRFEFIEMLPQPELLDAVVVDGIDVGAILRAMNERIALLLDRDHCLGHAYFMTLVEDRSLKRLAWIFRTSVLPLLQEYFFEDWQRVQWVLNDHRKPEELRFVRQPASDVLRLFGPDVPVNEQNRRWEINETAFSEVEAYTRILSAIEGI